MHRIKLQLRAIVYCFVALIILIILLILSGIGGIITLKERQKWVDHTNYVMNLTEIAESAFSAADYAGRNQMITGVDNSQLTELRTVSLGNIALLKEAVIDNPDQSNNLQSLESAVKESFKVQDEQIASAVKTDSVIIYRADTTTKRTQLIQSVDTLFAKVKINEINLMRNERFPLLALWQWRLVYFTSAIISLLLIVTVCSFYFLVRLLRRNIEAIEYMEAVIEKNKGGQVAIPLVEIEMLKTFLRQDDKKSLPAKS